MRSDAVALVVHPDPSVLAFATEALTIFQPGHHVATAPDLESASEWLETLTPSLVLLGSPCGPPEELRRWMKENRIEPEETVLIHSPDDPGSGMFHSLGVAATVAEPLGLPELLEAAHRVSGGAPTDENRCD